MKTVSIKCLALVTLLALTSTLSARADATKAATGTDLTGATAGVWSGGSGLNGSPASTDLGIWNSSSFGAGLTLGTDASWLGISASGALSNIGVSGAGNLTLGTSGISLSGTNMSITNNIILGGSQTWTATTSQTNWGNISSSGNVAFTVAGAGKRTFNNTNSFTGQLIMSVPTDVNGLLINTNNGIGLVTNILVIGKQTFSAPILFGPNTTNGSGCTMQLQPGTGRALMGLSSSAVWQGDVVADGSVSSSGLAYVVLSSGTATAPGIILGNIYHINTAGSVTVGTLGLRGAFYGAVMGNITYTNVGIIQLLDATKWKFYGTNNQWTTFDVDNAGAVLTCGVTNTLAPQGIMQASAAGGYLDLNGLPQTVGGINGLLRVTNTSATAVTLTLGGAAGSLTWTNGAGGPISLLVTGGTNNFYGTNLYTGLTTISNGVLKLVNAGRIVNSPGITLASGSARFDVSGVTGGYHLTNQILQGVGTVAGPVTVDSSATLTVSGGAATSTANLTNSGNLTLNGTTILCINKTGGVLANDAIVGFSALTYGGNLSVSNITSDSTALAIYDKFVLFPQGLVGSYSASAFVSSNLPALTGGLQWDLSQLTVDGSIQVYSPTTVFNPVLRPAPGGYVGATSVTITCQTPGATIYYTTDGTTPTTSSPVYSSAISVPVPTSLMTIKVYAVMAGLTDSSVVAGNYSTVVAPIWTSAAGGSWPVAANWFNNAVGKGYGVTADFSTLTLSSNLFVTLDGSQNIGNLIFGDQGNAFTWEVDSGSGGSLTLTGATTPAITVNNQSLTLNATVSSTNGLVMNGAGTSIWPVNPAITNGGITVNAGTFQVTAGNFGGQFTPGITINTNGTLVGGAAHALGGGTTVVINRGTYVLNDEDYKTNLTMIDGLVSQSGGDGQALRVGYSGGNGTSIWNVSNSVAGSVISAPINTIAAGVTLNLNVLRGAATTDLTISGPITGAGNLVFTGNGITALTTGNGNTGITTVSNGTVIVDGSIASSQVTVSGGTFAGSGVVAGAVAVNAGGTLAPGDLGTNIGTITVVGNVFFNAGSTNLMRISKNNNTPASDLVQSPPLLTAGGTLIVTNITSDGSPIVLGDTFTLFAAGGYGASPFASYVLPALPGLSWDTSSLLVNGTITVAANTAAPTINPPAGSYAGSVNATINSSTVGATIYYTTNGTTPTTGSSSGITPVTVTVPVSTSMTIQAYAHHAGLADSGLVSASYSTYSSAVWNNGGGGSWPVAGNWLNNAVPSGSPDITADFSTLALGGAPIVTLDSAPTVGNLIFGDQNNTYGWTINSGGAGPLTLAVSSGSPVITTLGQTTNTINAALAGTGGLIKNGPGALVLGGVNTYPGSTVVSNGALSAIGGTLGASPITLNSGTTLGITSGTEPDDVIILPGTGTNSLNLATGVTYAGSLSGSGTLLLSSTSYSQTRTFTAAANGGFSGVLMLQRGAYLFTANNADYSGADLQFVPTSSDAATYPTFTGSGISSIKSISAFNAATLEIAPTNTLNIVNGIITRSTNASFNATPIIQPSSGTSSLLTSSGGSMMFDCTTGPMTISSGVNLVDYNGSTPLNLSITGTNALTIGGVNTNSGTATINGGNLQLGTTGSLGTNTVTVSNGTVGNGGIIGGGVVVNNNGTLTGSGRVAGGVTVNTGGILSANGTILGPVAVQSGGILATATSGISTLSISNALTVAGNVSLRINKASATSDLVRGMTSVNYGGTLTVTNLSGTLTNGDSFILFTLASGGSYTGNFTATNLPALDPSLTWNWNPATGTLSVAVLSVGPSGPGTITNSISGNTLSLAWPAGQGWRLQMQTNDLSTGLQSNGWIYVTDGSVSSTNITVNPANPTVFYRLVYP